MRQPNIIFYFADQQRADTCGCYGQSLPVTPNLDALAAEGTCFMNAFTCQPVCGPARSCLQSGLYPTQTGCFRNAIALPQGITTLAGCFHDAGYQTAYVGKWHLATTRPSESGIGEGLPFYETTAIPKEYRGGYEDYWMAADVLEFTSHGYNGYVFDGDMRRHDFIGYRVDAINNYAIDFLHKRETDRPFFLFISQLEPHHQNDHGVCEGPDGSTARFGGFTPPADLPDGLGDWKQNYPDYLGACNALDANVGRLVDTLKEQGLWENTILIYASDHGCHFRTRTGCFKRSCHDSSIHVPLIAAGGPFAGKGQVGQVVSLMDLPRTLLDCAGIQAPGSFQGRSLLDLLRGAADWRNEVFIQISESEVGRALRTERYTYCVRADADGWQDAGSSLYREQYLYDNQLDPAQQVNLVSDPAYEPVRRRLREHLLARMAEAHEPIPSIVPAG